MTGPERPDEEALPGDPSGDDASFESAPDSGPDPMAALIKRSLQGPAAPASPNLLRGVQRRIRKRSRGKFFADGWSTTDGRVSHALIAVAMLLVLVIAYFAMGPIGIQ